MLFLFFSLWFDPPATPDVYGKVTAVEFFRWKIDGTRGIKIKFSVPLSVTPDHMELTLFDSMKGWEFVRMDAPGELYKHMSSNVSSQHWMLDCPNWPDRIRPEGNEMEFVAWGHRNLNKDDNLHEPMTAEYIEDLEDHLVRYVSKWVVLKVELRRWSFVEIAGDISSDRLSAIPGWNGHGGEHKYRFDVLIDKDVPDRAAWEKKVREATVWPYGVRNVDFVRQRGGSFEESWSNWKSWRPDKNAKYLDMLPLPIEKIDELVSQDK